VGNSQQRGVKGPKIVVFKHKRRKDYRKKTGHRQQMTRVKISSIDVTS
jgi:large subunit ribosomal protein L21